MIENKLELPMFTSMRGNLLLENNDEELEIWDSWYWYVDSPPSFFMGPFASKEEAQKDWDRMKRVEHAFAEVAEKEQNDHLSNCVYYEDGRFYQGFVNISFFKSKSMEFKAPRAFLK